MKLADAHRLTTIWVIAELAGAEMKQARARALDGEMRRQGIVERCVAVHNAIRTPEFGQRFNAAFDAVKYDRDRHCRGEDDVRAMAFAQLAEMGVDTADVHMLVFVHPDGRIRFGPDDPGAPLMTSPTIESRNRCLAALGMAHA